MPFSPGARRISQLVIDGDKDFSGRAILNVRLSGTVSGSPAWAEAQAFPPPLTGGNLVLHDTGLTLPRTFTFPDLADTVVTLSAPQTLSNKTLSAPIFSGTVTGAYTLGGSPTLASDLALSGARTFGGTLTVDPVNRRIGIGTMSPGVKLDVSSGEIRMIRPDWSGGNPEVVIGGIADQDGVRPAIGWFYTGGVPPARKELARIDSHLVDHDTAHLRFWTNNAGSFQERMRITSTGNVGIGTMAPVQKLHVEGNTYISGNVGIGTTGPLARLEVFGGDISLRGAVSTVCSILFKSTHGNVTVGSIDAALSFWGLDYLRFRPLRNYGGGNYGSHFMGVIDSPAGYPVSNQHLSINTDTLKGEAVLYVDSTGGRHTAVFMNGNVGIGTTGPAQRLHVEGNTYISGNVGIGTTAPEFRLDVAGSLVVRGDIMPNADNQGNVGLDDRRWAMVRSVLVVSGDFVFENGWRLTEWGEGIALLRPDGSVAASWT